MQTKKTAAFITLGCKINQYETEAIRQEVLDLGFDEVDSRESADVYVVNTCAVTSTSGTKSRKYIQRAARTNPEAQIVVVGCSTPSEKESFQKIPQVALLAGNEEKAMVASFIAGLFSLGGGGKPGDTQLGGAFPSQGRDILDLRVSRYRDRTRATIKVQDGCNNFCSFCIIPFLRGLSKSRELEGVIDEIRELVANGYLEVVLSGVHLQDYGLDLDPKLDLVTLLGRIVEIPGLRRMRLSSLGPRAFTPELLDLLEHPVFCRHWHIPLQAGSDRVLEAMKRGYTVADFRHAVAELERRVEDPSITADIIVGHPGETEEDFEDTIRHAREFGFSKIHVFPFSMREGTLAEKLAHKGVVDPAEVRRRVVALGEVEKELREGYNRRFVGRTLDVLVEGEAKKALFGPNGAEVPTLEGLADRYLKVRFPSPSEHAIHRFGNTIQRVRVEVADLDGLEGSWAEPPVDADEAALLS